MCLYKRGNRKRAKKDIIAYKVLVYNRRDARFHSMYKNYIWDIGVEQEAKKARPGRISKDGEVGSGYFHSYKYAFAINISESTLDYKTCIFRCIIPKGSYYYEGFHSDGIDGYASKKLKIVEELYRAGEWQ